MEILAIFPSWLLTSVLVIFMFNIFLRRLKSNKSSISVDPKLPPNPPKLPIIGNLHHLVGKPHHQALWQLSQKYGPVMLVHIGSKPFLVISSSSMAKQILKTQDHIFCSRPMNYASKRITYNFLDVAFSPQSDRRREMRKILVSEFFNRKRAKFLNVLAMENDSMVRSLSLHPPNTVVNLNKIMLATISGVICKVGFGVNFSEEPLKGVSWGKMLEESMVVLNGSFVDSFPWIGRIIDHFSGWNGRLERCFNDLDSYIEMVIDQHHNRTEPVTSDDDKDFVQVLLELSSVDTASDYRLTKEDVKAHVMDVLTGGIDTTVVTAVWAMSEIARNPRVMKKLQSEIRNCASRTQNAHELDIKKMTYLNSVVKETLRLHPPAPLLIPHKSLSDSHIGGYDVFCGTTVLINGWGIGRDVSTWGENAAEFYPERFENLDVDYGRGSCDLIPFGGGRRSCPAIKTAPETVEAVIANLLYWFDWELPNGVKNDDLDMQEEGTLIIRRKLPLLLVATKHYGDDNKQLLA
ncbi:hypothetical protein L1987_08475 [Smallanthus sonchifolius]|uniref:Uncharacterized protein n=1 Tax=Smallanthus sonchifolius TaxID=185202 RepID=A0ACB9JMI4_9ASTR|nr:hypothetical protein L1987_08475 [Smallanthus sonchifolius]